MFLAGDLRRYLPVVRFLALAGAAFGALMLGLDWAVGMPLPWTRRPSSGRFMKSLHDSMDARCDHESGGAGALGRLVLGRRARWSRPTSKTSRFMEEPAGSETKAPCWVSLSSGAVLP